MRSRRTAEALAVLQSGVPDSARLWGLLLKTVTKKSCQVESRSVRTAHSWAMSALENSVTLWIFKSNRTIPPALYGHTQTIASVAFRRDGKALASGSADGDIRLWDVETHELLGTLGAQQKAIKSVVFNPQRGILASVGEDDSIVFWEVDFEDWSSHACRVANRNLTPKEWNTYFGNRSYRKTCPNL